LNLLKLIAVWEGRLVDWETQVIVNSEALVISVVANNEAGAGSNEFISLAFYRQRFERLLGASRVVPMTNDVIASAGVTSARGHELFDMSAQVTAAVRHRGAVSFAARFGDTERSSNPQSEANTVRSHWRCQALGQQFGRC
jgi:hypothetical protein